MRRRIVSLLLTFSILLPMLPLSVLTAFAQDTTLYGDADGNGTVDMSDVNLMEQYIDGDAQAQSAIHFNEADVNADDVVNSDDVALVKEYLAGNIQLTDDLCTVSFDTGGGGEIDPIKVGRGYAIMQEIPSPGKEGEVFIGWKKADGKPVLNADLWRKLNELVSVHRVTFVKVKGHADNELNNRCDALARGAIRKLSETEQ